MEQYEYLDCLIDFHTAIVAHGATKVANDFRNAYPSSNSAFMNAAVAVQRHRQIAALFKPVVPVNAPPSL